MVRARSDRASTALLVSKIQMGPRAIPSVIASDAAASAAWSEWHKYKSMWSITSDDADARSERTLRQVCV